jgi:hypothetical protein
MPLAASLLYHSLLPALAALRLASAAPSVLVDVGFDATGFGYFPGSISAAGSLTTSHFLEVVHMPE